MDDAVARAVLALRSAPEGSNVRIVLERLGQLENIDFARRHSLARALGLVQPDADLADEPPSWKEIQAAVEKARAETPRHLHVAIGNATRAFRSGDIGALATVNEDIQQLVDAAVDYARRMVKAAGR